jgi:hypothetical protein
MPTFPDQADDPSWLSPRALLWALVPPLAVRRAQRAGDLNTLQMLRLFFTSFALSIVLIGVAVLLIADDEKAEPRLDVSLVAAGVVAYGLLSLVVPRLIERPLPCSDETALVVGYRTRLFLRIAFANAAALIGFVGFSLSEEAWMYPLGALFTVMGYARLAPSRRNLENDQQELSQRGCSLSLASALARSGAATTETNKKDL